MRPERMLANIDASHGLPFSGRLLLALVEAGLTREAAYEVVQRNAMRAWESGEHLRELVLADAEAAGLDADVVAAAFELDRALAHAETAFEHAAGLLAAEPERAGAR